MFQFETFQGCNSYQQYQCKTTRHEDQYIRCVLKQNPFLPLCNITNKISLPISEQTVHYRRLELDLGSYIAAEKPGLKLEHMNLRMEWAPK